jgi:hypothetical protein
LLEELLAGLARAAGATTLDPEELSLVSTTPASIRMRPQIRTTSPPATAEPKLVEKNLLIVCTSASVGGRS